jgi:hypothetical protein
MPGVVPRVEIRKSKECCFCIGVALTFRGRSVLSQSVHNGQKRQRAGVGEWLLDC